MLHLTPHYPPLDLHTLEGKDAEERREIMGEYIYKRADQMFGAQAASTIAGFLLEFSYEELEPLLTNPSILDNNIREAQGYLVG